MAFNFGRHFRGRGGELSGLSPLLPQLRPLGLNAAQLDALARLGPDAFQRWAVRGWFDGGS